MLRNVFAALQMRLPTLLSTSATHQRTLIKTIRLSSMDTQLDASAPTDAVGRLFSSMVTQFNESPPTDAVGHAAGHAAGGAACQAVFETAELLEAILLELSPRQIMASQRVYRQFRDVVATSLMLRQKVFLAPKNRPVPEGKWAIEGNARNFSYRSVLSYDQGHQDARKVLSVATRNSVLFQPIESEGTSAALRFLSRRNYGGEWLRMRQELLTSVHKFIEGEPQSWQNFQITDPPCLKASMRFIIRFSNYAVTITTVSVSDANGVTLATLLGAVPVHALRYSAYGVKYESARQAVLRVQDKKGIRGRITCLQVTLDGMIAPNESERQQVERQGLGEGTRTLTPSPETDSVQSSRGMVPSTLSQNGSTAASLQRPKRNEERGTSILVPRVTELHEAEGDATDE